MLCSLCQHGVTSKIDDEPTGATWDCPCGETNCRHIWRCQCGRSKRRKYKPGDAFRLLKTQTDDADNQARETPEGALVIISRIEADNTDNPYVVCCHATGGWWFFSQAELEREAELVDAIRPPAQGDYLGLGNECHTTIDAEHGCQGNGEWLIEDDHGEDFRVVRDPGNDNDERRAWRKA
jgi:hypothetical protein